MRLLSAEGQQIALPGSTYGYDVLVRIGWLRQEKQTTFAEIEDELSARVCISESHLRYLYQQVYLPLLACHERQHWNKLEQAAEHYGGLIIALDGLAPEGGEPQLWFIREVLTGLTLRSGWLSQQDQTTFEAFLEPVAQLPWSILAVLSDKQKGLVPAVATVLPHSRHQFCQGHYLRNLAEPLAEADEAFKVELRQTIRQEVGAIIRPEKPADAPEAGVLTVTGLLPSPLAIEGAPSANPEPVSIVEETAIEAGEIIDSLTRRMRYLLTLKGRPPFRLAGIEMYQRFQEVNTLTEELLTHRADPRLESLSQGLQRALSLFTSDYQDWEQGAGWLKDIAAILGSPTDSQVSGEQVAQQLRTYLDDLCRLPDLSPRLDAFRQHLDKVSISYWPGLFHCYDIEGLSRTNNGLESHFRDTQRQLLRTTGQKGQTRRTLQRTGAWELLPRPSDEAERLAILRQVPRTELVKEQQRLRQHRERFRLYTRSVRRANAQLDKLRQRWLALPAHDLTG
jgi:predicted Rdx family selenoprotein